MYAGSWGSATNPVQKACLGARAPTGVLAEPQRVFGEPSATFLRRSRPGGAPNAAAPWSPLTTPLSIMALAKERADFSNVICPETGRAKDARAKGLCLEITHMQNQSLWKQHPLDSVKKHD